MSEFTLDSTLDSVNSTFPLPSLGHTGFGDLQQRHAGNRTGPWSLCITTGWWGARTGSNCCYDLLSRISHETTKHLRISSHDHIIHLYASLISSKENYHFFVNSIMDTANKNQRISLVSPDLAVSRFLVMECHGQVWGYRDPNI